MRAEVSARLRPGGPWLPAVLTTERAESSYGLPVVVMRGEYNARGTAEVECIRVGHDVPANLVDAAVNAGYLVVGVPGPAVPDQGEEGDAGEEDIELDPEHLELTADRGPILEPLPDADGEEDLALAPPATGDISQEMEAR